MKTYGKRTIEPATRRGGIVNDEIAALKQEIAELKKQTEPYKAGDTISVNEGGLGIPLSGYVTSDTTGLHFTFPVNKPINASKATVSKLTADVRYAGGGYINTESFAILDLMDGTTVMATVYSNVGVLIVVTNKKGWHPYGNNSINNYAVSLNIQSLSITLS